MQNTESPNDPDQYEAQIKAQKVRNFFFALSAANLVFIAIIIWKATK